MIGCMILGGLAALGAVAGEGMEGGESAGGIHPEHGATPGRAARRRRAVEVAVTRLDEARLGLAALGAAAGEVVKGGEGARGIHPEDGAPFVG